MHDRKVEPCSENNSDSRTQPIDAGECYQFTEHPEDNDVRLKSEQIRYENADSLYK